MVYLEFPARGGGEAMGCGGVEINSLFLLHLSTTLAPSMDIDRPLDELIKKRNKAGGRKQQQQQKKTQQKNQRGGNKQSNKNQNKNAGGNGRRRNDKVKNGNNINLGVSNKSKKSIGKASGPRSNTNLSSRLVPYDTLSSF